MESTITRSVRIDAAPLRDLIDGDVVTPDDDAWDEARLAWNLSVDQRPVAVALPNSPADVVAVVTFARETGLRVAPQGTGHGAAALGDLSDTILLKTERLRGVEIDPEARLARVGAGTIWIEVVEAAAEHGLAALAGSSPDVGVVGYTLGGGLSWLSRAYGLGANRVTAIEVVTAIEFELFPVEEVVAGILWFPVERSVEVLKAWRAWTETVPDELTSVGRILQFPPIPEIPEPVRGKSFVVVQAILLGNAAEADALLAPLRALGPVLDTVAPMPVASLSQLHMDPDGPAAGVGDGQLLDDITEDTIEALVDRTVGAPLLSVELRHLGGAIARRRPGHGALAAFDASFAMYAVGALPVPELRPAVEAAAAAVLDATSPHASEHTYLNFAETRRSPQTLFSSASYHRLRQIKALVDPHGTIRSNHPIPPAR